LCTFSSEVMRQEIGAAGVHRSGGARCDCHIPTTIGRECSLPNGYRSTLRAVFIGSEQKNLYISCPLGRQRRQP